MKRSPIRAVYIEGFSPGPGLPHPLLDRANFEVETTRMPYEVSDLAWNPFVFMAGLSLVSTFWLVSVFANDEYSGWRVPVTLAVGCVLCIVFKRLAVGYCLDRCVMAFARLIKAHRPDIIIGYSWGGGIAVALLNRGLWAGATLLLSPAGEQMWLHAGRSPPSLRSGVAVPETAKVLTVQGDADPIVPLDAVRRLHVGCADAQCRLLVVSGGDHVLRGTVTATALERWGRSLLGLE